jgi:hypothetical protein
MNPIFFSKFDTFCSAGGNQCGIHCPPKYMANLFCANSSSKFFKSPFSGFIPALACSL